MKIKDEINEEMKHRKKSKKTTKKSDHKHEYVRAIFIIDGFRSPKVGKVCCICEKHILEWIINLESRLFFEELETPIEDLLFEPNGMKVIRLNKKLDRIL